jgi:hypothetical protein
MAPIFWGRYRYCTVRFVNCTLSYGWSCSVGAGGNLHRSDGRFACFPWFPMVPHGSPWFPMVPHGSPCLPACLLVCLSFCVFILSHPIPSHPVPSRPVLSCPVLFCPTLSRAPCPVCFRLSVCLPVRVTVIACLPASLLVSPFRTVPLRARLSVRLSVCPRLSLSSTRRPNELMTR